MQNWVMLALWHHQLSNFAHNSVYASQVLFSPKAKQFLPAGLEPLKLVVRLEGHPSSLRHIRQLKSSSIGIRCPICNKLFQAAAAAGIDNK